MIRRFELAVIHDVISETDSGNTDKEEVCSFNKRPVIGVGSQSGAKNNHEDHQHEGDHSAFIFRAPRHHPTKAGFLHEADEDSNGQAHVISDAE